MSAGVVAVGACACRVHVVGPKGALLAATEAWFPHRAARQALLVDNPARLYGFV